MSRGPQALKLPAGADRSLRVLGAGSRGVGGGCGAGGGGGRRGTLGGAMAV